VVINVTPMTNRDDRPRWTAELESALLREIVREYKRLNGTYFKDRLVVPQIALAEGAERLGRWVQDTRVLELSRPLVIGRPWGVSVEVLKHEMLHQFVFEVLGVRDETAHGATFREIGQKLGIDTRAAGMPNGEGDANGEPRRVLDRITKLLALAESPNQHEAEAAMAAAQRLLFKHNVELLEARAQRGYSFRHVGTAKGRIYEPDRLLASILTTYFFVEGIWISVYRPAEKLRGSVLEICGTLENLEIAEYVHGFLNETSERLWKEHTRLHDLPGRERRTFLAGVMSGVSDRLNAESKKRQREGLVWVKDGDLSDFYRQRHPYVRSVRYATSRGSDAYERGREAGRRVIIYKGMKRGPSGTVKLLGPGN
jgi:hypothetical protein